ncbi:MAG TPA: fibrobacter succinogenes major paralogous domain-containing protein [Myxococcota bacterium]|nr:fibrobacter succinogenes major paralogous domain-containing protein [Myxococcota bacterium]HRY97226.1 fibrobacter succinogenes major paralogous domain-containing protein [Myxococcota bacterium]HSA20661.1 fibrobacter succinogenes major paralogous domain-containing protein [Myxococcota bacterium]
MGGSRPIRLAALLGLAAWLAGCTKEPHANSTDPPGDYAAFAVQETFPAVAAFAGQDAALVSIEAYGVTSSGAVDLLRPVQLCAELRDPHVRYQFVRPFQAVAVEAPTPEEQQELEARIREGVKRVQVAPPGAPAGYPYQAVEVSVGERHSFSIPRSTWARFDVKRMAREVKPADRPGLQVPAPKIAFSKIWAIALAEGAPPEDMAAITYDLDGYHFVLEELVILQSPQGSDCSSHTIFEMQVSVDGQLLFSRGAKGVRDERAAVFKPERGTFTDGRDGRSYRSIAIGRQVWMAENLAHPSPGSWCHSNQPRNCEKLGRLYTWDEARAACPAGWHLPSDLEWQWLERHLGMNRLELEDQGKRGEADNVGGKLADRTAWSRRGTDVSNESGFSALSAGYRMPDGTFTGLGRWAEFWTATRGPEGPFHRGLHCDWYESVVRYDHDAPETGYSVRCLRDRPRFE